MMCQTVLMAISRWAATTRAIWRRTVRFENKTRSQWAKTPTLLYRTPAHPHTYVNCPPCVQQCPKEIQVRRGSTDVYSGYTYTCVCITILICIYIYIYSCLYICMCLYISMHVVVCIYVIHTYHKVQVWMCPPTAHRGLIPRIIAHGLASRNRNLHGTRPRFAYASQLASQSLSYMLASWELQPPCHGSNRHGKGMCRCRLSLEGPGLNTHKQIYVHK